MKPSRPAALRQPRAMALVAAAFISAMGMAGEGRAASTDRPFIVLPEAGFSVRPPPDLDGPLGARLAPAPRLVRYWGLSGGKAMIALSLHTAPPGMSTEEVLEDWGASPTAVTVGDGIAAYRADRVFEGVLELTAFIPAHDGRHFVELAFIVKDIADWAERPMAELRRAHGAEFASFATMLASVRLTAPFHGPTLEAMADTAGFELFRSELRVAELTGDAAPETIQIVSVRGRDTGAMAATWVTVFQTRGRALASIHRVHVESFGAVRFLDVTGDGVSELVIEGVFGAHGHFLNVVTFAASGALDLWKELNPLGVSLTREAGGRPAVLTGIEPLAAAWSYADPHPWRLYTWNGERFAFDRIVPSAEKWGDR